MNVLVFFQAGVGRAIRIHQTVHTEVAVMLRFTMVAAVPVHGFAIFSNALVDGVIAPFPDKAATVEIVGDEELEIVFKVSGAIAHRMRVFTKQQRLVRRIRQVILHLLNRRIHSAENINVAEVILAAVAAIQSAFIMGQSGGVILFGPLQSFFEGAAIGTFVTHGPDQNAGTVFVPQNQTASTVKGGLNEVGIVGDHLVPALKLILAAVVCVVDFRGAVTFVIGLIDDIETILVTELIENRRIGIVAGTNSIHVMLLHQEQILLHLFHRNGKTSNRIGVVTVDAAEANGLIVQ